MESPVRWEPHAGFGERPGETDQQQCRHRAPGRLNPTDSPYRWDTRGVLEWRPGVNAATSTCLPSRRRRWSAPSSAPGARDASRCA